MDKKNTLLLTAIAIATLLVAVVGATFAYFTAQRGEGQNADIQVKTSTTDTLTFDTKSLYLLATQQNFANVYDESAVDDHAGSQKVVSTSTVDYKKGGPGSKDYCYKVTLNIGSNNFVYAPGSTDFGTDDQDGRNRTTRFKSQNAPELLLKITKKTEKKTQGTEAFSEESSIEYGHSSNNPLKKVGGEGSCSSSDLTVLTDCVYYESLETQRKVCTQNNTSDPSGDNITYTDSCEDRASIEGFDVTVLNNTTVSDIANSKISQIGIPSEDGGDNYEHKLHTDTEGDEIKDTWTAELVFVNYNWDQQYNASPNVGDAKKFNATFKFETVECTS